MSTIQERQQTHVWTHDRVENGFAPPRVFLQPVAAPSILGFAGFAAATFVVASNLAGWWGTPASPLALAPFAAMLGGVAQFAAGMWAFRARDAVASLFHGTWGAFWLAYLILNILVATGVVTQPSPWYHSPEVGFWFFAVAITTAIASVAAITESLALFSAVATTAAGAGILAGAFIYGSHGWTQVAGWVLVFAAGFAWYLVASMTLVAATGRTILPSFSFSRAANVPGERPIEPIELEWAEPGVKMGQ